MNTVTNPPHLLLDPDGGPRQFHLYPVSPLDADLYVECPPGWRLWYETAPGSPPPAGAVQVGTCRVRTGDPSLRIFLRPAPEAPKG